MQTKLWYSQFPCCSSYYLELSSCRHPCLFTIQFVYAPFKKTFYFNTSFNELGDCLCLRFDVFMHWLCARYTFFYDYDVSTFCSTLPRVWNNYYVMVILSDDDMSRFSSSASSQTWNTVISNQFSTSISTRHLVPHLRTGMSILRLISRPPNVTQLSACSKHTD